MKKSILPALFVYACFGALPAIAQHNVRLSGFVRAVGNKHAIAEVTVKIKSQNFFTESNQDGYFEFNFPFNNNYDSLQLSAFGFWPKSVAVSGFRFQQEVLLDPTLITPEQITPSLKKLTSKEIIEKAVGRIPVNYADTFSIQGYFRRQEKTDSLCSSWLEEVVEINDDRFAKKKSKNDKEHIRILAERKSNTTTPKSYPSPLPDSIATSGHMLLRLLSQNDVRYKSGLLASGNEYDTARFTWFGRRLCYEIAVVRKDHSFVKSGFVKIFSTLVIDAKDFSIYRITDDEHPRKRNNAQQYALAKKANAQVSFRVTDYTRIVEFRRVDGKLVLGYISEAAHAEEFKTTSGEVTHVFDFVRELMINKVNPSIPENLFTTSLKEREKIHTTRDPYHKEFWESVNLIPLTQKNFSCWEALSKSEPIQNQFQKNN